MIMNFGCLLSNSFALFTTVTRVLGISTRKKEFKSLMKSLSNVFLDSADEVALSNTCTAMVALAKGNHARSSEALLALKSTATSLFKKLVDLSKQKQEIRENGVKDSGEKVDVEDLDIAMNLCLRRLAILSKRWPIYRLIDTGREEDEGVEAVSRAIADYLLAELKAREVTVNEEGTENETIEIPDIWTNDLYSAECHQVVASSVSEGLNFLVGMLAWRFTEELKDDTIEYDEDTVDNHIVLRMRKRVIQTILCCFEHYLDGHEEDMFSDEHHTFATDVNAHGWRVYGDLRALFPHKCAKSPSLLLKKVAIVQDKVLSGAGMRFMASQDYQVRCSLANSVYKLTTPLVARERRRKCGKARGDPSVAVPARSRFGAQLGDWQPYGGKPHFPPRHGQWQGMPRFRSHSDSGVQKGKKPAPKRIKK